MTTPARMAEADRVELVYYWALNQLGNAILIDSLDLWSTVPATQAASRASWWLVELLKILLGFRKEAQELAIRYYRLVRALRTGTTIGIDGEVSGDTVSLEHLRQEFEDIIEEIDRETVGDVAPDMGSESPGGSTPEPPLELGDDEDAIEIDQEVDVNEIINAHDERDEKQAIDTLDTLGVSNLLKKLDTLTPDEAHEAAGNRQAAAAMRIMLNAARGLVYDLADTDLKVLGWARYSRTGTPCAFCAMLISRGVVYKTRAQALGTDALGNPDEYHDNCRCVAVPIFLQEQEDGDLFAQNRYYRDLWDEHIKGRFTGKDALNEWRSLLRRLNRQAQAAA